VLPNDILFIGASNMYLNVWMTDDHGDNEDRGDGTKASVTKM